MSRCAFVLCLKAFMCLSFMLLQMRAESHVGFEYYCADDTKSSVGDSSKILEEVNADNGALESTTSNNLLANLIDTCEGLPDFKEACHQSNLSKDDEKLEASSSIEWHQSNTLTATHNNFPRSAQAFVNAIKRNRAYQKFIRSKLTQIEARIEENNKLKERVKILKDFQISLRKRTGKALSQKKDPRIQLISARKPNNSKDSEVCCWWFFFPFFFSCGSVNVLDRYAEATW